MHNSLNFKHSANLKCDLRELTVFKSLPRNLRCRPILPLKSLTTHQFKPAIHKHAPANRILAPPLLRPRHLVLLYHFFWVNGF